MADPGFTTGAVTEEQAPDGFAGQVRDALRHLYDNAYLVRHPLAELLFGETPSEGMARGKAVRMLLLDTIESLRPPEGTRADSPAWRPYNILRARYIECGTSAEAMKNVSLAHSQYHEQHRLALERVVDALWKGRPASAEGGTSDARRWSKNTLLQREVTRLGARQTGTSVALPEVIEGVLAMFASVAAERELQLSSTWPEGRALPAVHTDRVLLRQLLIQVLGNAVRQAQRGEVAVSASPEGKEVNVGLRASSLGLGGGPLLDRAAQELAMALGARLEEGQPGPHEGCVALHLPVKRRSMVLLIDNDRDLGDLFRRYLVGDDWNLVSIQNADDGLRMAVQLRPDVVVLDVIMPDRDGWDVLAQLRSSSEMRDVPIIVCSVLQQPELALALGADAFLPKPVDQFTLQKALAALRPDSPGNPAPQT
jgi:CheY-like chemotaxis protein